MTNEISPTTICSNPNELILCNKKITLLQGRFPVLDFDFSNMFTRNFFRSQITNLVKAWFYNVSKWSAGSLNSIIVFVDVFFFLPSFYKGAQVWEKGALTFQPSSYSSTYTWGFDWRCEYFYDATVNDWVKFRVSLMEMSWPGKTSEFRLSYYNLIRIKRVKL